MTAAEIRAVVHEVLAEERQRANENFDTTVYKTIGTILTSFGINDDDRREIRADFQHLRRWRKSVEQVQTTGVRVAIGVVITGIAGLLWMGFKLAVGK